MRRTPRSTLFPYTTLFRSWRMIGTALALGGNIRAGLEDNLYLPNGEMAKSNGELIEVAARMTRDCGRRSEEHTSELQSHVNLVCRLLLEKKKKKYCLWWCV